MRIVCSVYKALIISLLAGWSPISVAYGSEDRQEVQAFLEQYCFACHGGEKVKGKIDLKSALQSDAPLAEQFELWESVRDALEFEEMPPEDELQPAERERVVFLDWYQANFVDSVEAQPGEFQPRRLSVIEYRNTLESLLGFELETAIMEAEQTVAEKSLVVKLLPTDPPGKSGFTNDTHGNPLTTVIWDQYSYLVDNALEQLFSKSHRSSLERYTGPISGDTLAPEQAIQMIENFVPKAWRRAVAASELEVFLTPLEGKEGRPLVASLKRELKAALMSPRFLYRGLLVEGKPGEQSPVDSFELAERLSYFLWADMPDDDLSALAENGTLSEEATLRSQVTRLLDHPASRNLAENFAVQWLALDDIRNVSKNPPVADALYTQPVDFIDHLFRDDRPLLELIDSRTTFINPHTAKFYPGDRKQMARYVKQKGIEVESVANQKITLERNAGPRGGLLTMPGVLAMNHGPVIRGTWMLERILGDHLGEPPADVGQIPQNGKGENLSFRERFEMHRNNSTCAVCHDKIDPLGFALQAYDKEGIYLLDEEALAAARKKNKGAEESIESIDTTGTLPSGESFSDFEELKTILTTTQRRTVIRNIVERTLSYALCRKLEIYDEPTIDEITDRLDASDGTFRDLVSEVVFSLPFREASFPAAES